MFRNDKKNAFKVFNNENLKRCEESFLIDIFESDELNIEEEIQVFRICERYCKEKNLFESKLMSCVRYPFIPAQLLLREVKNSSFVPPHLYLQSLEYILDSSFKNQTDLIQILNLRKENLKVTKKQKHLF